MSSFLLTWIVSLIVIFLPPALWIAYLCYKRVHWRQVIGTMEPLGEGMALLSNFFRRSIPVRYTVENQEFRADAYHRGGPLPTHLLKSKSVLLLVDPRNPKRVSIVGFDDRFSFIALWMEPLTYVAVLVLLLGLILPNLWEAFMTFSSI